jgi:hypothetical protein
LAPIRQTTQDWKVRENTTQKNVIPIVVINWIPVKQLAERVNDKRSKRNHPEIVKAITPNLLTEASFSAKLSRVICGARGAI